MTPGGWTSYARKIEQAGAAALELNIYHVAADQKQTAGDVEERYLEITRQVVGTVKIPVAIKLGAFFSSFANMAVRLCDAGARGLVLFNRFYQPDFDLDTLDVVPSLTLSHSHEMRLPLRWVAILHGRVDADSAITSGVHTYRDVLNGLMAGARVTMMASELLREGLTRIGEILEGLKAWMET